MQPPPTHVFASAGWQEQDLGCGLQELETTLVPGAKAFYITHPAERDQPTPKVMRQSCAPRVFDRQGPTFGLPSFMYWDNMHLLSMANQELNHMLLDHVCPLS